MNFCSVCLKWWWEITENHFQDSRPDRLNMLHLTFRFKFQNPS
jgi:hypothetical protein